MSGNQTPFPSRRALHTKPKKTHSPLTTPSKAQEAPPAVPQAAIPDAPARPAPPIWREVIDEAPIQDLPPETASRAASSSLLAKKVPPPPVRPAVVEEPISGQTGAVDDEPILINPSKESLLRNEENPSLQTQGRVAAAVQQPQQAVQQLEQVGYPAPAQVPPEGSPLVEIEEVELPSFDSIVANCNRAKKVSKAPGYLTWFLAGIIAALLAFVGFLYVAQPTWFVKAPAPEQINFIYEDRQESGEQPVPESEVDLDQIYEETSGEQSE